MKAEQPKPLFGTIAKSGGTFTVTYHEELEPQRAVNITRQGYSAETFRECPEDMPVIDNRPADAGEILKLVFAVDGIKEVNSWIEGAIPLAEYLEKARQTGAVICTVKDVIAN